MHHSFYIPIIVMLVLLYILLRNKKIIAAKKVIQKRRSEDITNMLELAKQFIGKECVIYSFDASHQFTGTIKEVADGAILLEKDGKLEAINLDFVIRIREFPTNKNGKKKSVILD